MMLQGGQGCRKKGRSGVSSLSGRAGRNDKAELVRGSLRYFRELPHWQPGYLFSTASIISAACVSVSERGSSGVRRGAERGQPSSSPGNLPVYRRCSMSLYTGDAPCEPWTAEKGLAAASKGKETQNRLWIATCILGLWGVQSV